MSETSSQEDAREKISATARLEWGILAVHVVVPSSKINSPYDVVSRAELEMMLEVYIERLHTPGRDPFLAIVEIVVDLHRKVRIPERTIPTRYSVIPGATHRVGQEGAARYEPTAVGGLGAAFAVQFAAEAK